MPTRPDKGKIRIPSIPNVYGIEEATIRKAVADGELYATRGWISKVALRQWIEARASGPIAPDTRPISDAAKVALGLNEDLHISERLLEEVDSVAKIAGAKSSVAKSNESRLLAMRQAGRLADTVETVVLIDHVLSEFLSEVRSLTNDMQDDIAKMAGISASKAREILDVVTNRLMKAGSDIADNLEAAEDAHVAALQDKVRRTGRKAR